MAAPKELTPEYLVDKKATSEMHGHERLWSVTDIKNLFRGCKIDDANVVEIDSEGKTRKFVRLSDVKLKGQE